MRTTPDNKGNKEATIAGTTRDKLVGKGKH